MEKKIIKFISGDEIVRRLALKEVAAALAYDGNVYHSSHNRQIFMPNKLEKKPLFDHNLNKISMLLGEECFAVEMPDEVFEFFDVTISSGNTEFLLSARPWSKNDGIVACYTGKTPIKLYSISTEKNVFLTPRCWTITSQNFPDKILYQKLDCPKLSFRLKDEKTVDFSQIEDSTLKFISHEAFYLSGFCSKSFETHINVMPVSASYYYFKINNFPEPMLLPWLEKSDPVVFEFTQSMTCYSSISKSGSSDHVEDLLKFVGISIYSESNNFTIDIKEWKKFIDLRKQTVHEHLNFTSNPNFMYGQGVTEQVLYDQIPLRSGQTHQASLSEEIENFYKILDKVLTSYAMDNQESFILSDSQVRQLLLIIYPFLHLLTSESNLFSVNFMEIRSVGRCEHNYTLSCQKDTDRYALITDSEKLSLDVTLFAEGSYYASVELGDKEQKERLVFLWKNKAKYFQEIQGKEPHPLEHQEEYFEFDEDLFIDLHYFENPREGRDKYIEILKSYRYDEEEVVRFVKRNQRLPENEKEVRAELVKIYQKIKADLSSHVLQSEKTLIEKIDIYIMKLKRKHENKDRSVWTRAKDRVKEYAITKKIPFLELDDRIKDIPLEELEEIREAIKEYNAR